MEYSYWSIPNSNGYWVLSRLTNYVDQKTLLKIYYSMMHSHLNYSTSSWSNACPTNLEYLFKLEK